MPKLQESVHYFDEQDTLINNEMKEVSSFEILDSPSIDTLFKHSVNL